MFAALLVAASFVPSKASEPIPGGRDVLVVVPGFAIRGDDYRQLAMKAGFSPADTLFLDPWADKAALERYVRAKRRGDPAADDVQVELALKAAAIVDAAVDWDNDRVVLMVHSLGSSMANVIFRDRAVAALVLVSVGSEALADPGRPSLIVESEYEFLGLEPRRALERRALVVAKALAERRRRASPRRLLGATQSVTHAIVPGGAHCSCLPRRAALRHRAWGTKLKGATSDVPKRFHWTDRMDDIGARVRAFLAGATGPRPSDDSFFDTWAFLQDESEDAEWMAGLVAAALPGEVACKVRVVVHESEESFLTAPARPAYRGSLVVHACQPDGPLAPWWLKAAAPALQGQPLARHVWAWAREHVGESEAAKAKLQRDRALRTTQRWAESAGPSFPRVQCAAVHEDGVVYLKVPSRGQAVLHVLDERFGALPRF